MSEVGSFARYATSMPSVTWAFRICAETAGGSWSWTFSPPDWFSMNASGFPSLPMSW